MQQADVLPVTSCSLIVEHVTGANVMLQPFVIGEPVHALVVVLSWPTFVVSQ